MAIARADFPDLSALLNPGNVALIGATAETTGLRGQLTQIMMTRRFGGRIFPVARAGGEIFKQKVYATVSDVPEPLDLAVLAIPAAFVPDALKECADMGIGAASIISAGFADDPGGDGALLQARVQEIAKETGMVVSGPNSLGIANLETGLCASFSRTLEDIDSPLSADRPNARRVAVVSQSGGMGFALYDLARRKGLRCSHVVTTGNEACLETMDVVNHLIENDAADVFLMFVEGFRTPAKLPIVATKALKAGKPIVMIKIGRSDAGARAAASHTAALVGAYGTFDALFRRYAITVGEDMDHLVDLAGAFSQLGHVLPRGNRVGIFTTSGGAGGMCADICGVHGLEVPPLDSRTRAKIDERIPSMGSSENPVDPTAGALKALGFAEISRMISDSPEIDTVMAAVTLRHGNRILKETEALTELGRTLRKPVIFWSFNHPDRRAADMLSHAGLPLFTDLRNASHAIKAMATYSKARQDAVARGDVDVPELPLAARDLLNDAPDGLTEFEAMRVLQCAGISGAGGKLVRSLEEAGLAAEEFAGPVVLKIQSPDIPHKSHAGGVELNIQGADAIKAAFTAIGRRVAQSSPDAHILGVLVQPMAPPGLEMILGIDNRSGFGPLLMVGFGGTAVEQSRDVVFAPADLTRQEALSLVGQLKGAAFLNPDRHDLDALADLMVGLGRFAISANETVAEIDLNPVLLHAPGRGVSLVDALIFKNVAARSS